MGRLDTKGFTLVETVISVVLGTFVIVSIGFALESGIFTATDNRSRLYGLNALQKELETLRQMNYDSFVALGASSSFSNSQLSKLSAGTGTRSIAATSFGDDIKKLTLTVTWTGRNGSSLSKSLTTYVTRKGLNGS
jgi:type II secretory pathway pseudopilin PulG